MIYNNLKIALWNANGLASHSQEIQNFILTQNIDIMLISESHCTNRSFIRIPDCNVYITTHPNGAGHGGTAIIIKRNIKHYEIEKYQHDYLQATSVVVEDWSGPITFSAIYCPPRHIIQKDHFMQFYRKLGTRFIAGGDYNAKHQMWGSRLTTTRGRELWKAIQEHNLNHLSTGEPTYWPTDRNKIPDLIDFCITKGISPNYMTAKSCLDLSSDHSPVLITLSSQIVTKPKKAQLCNKYTNWDEFRSILNNSISCNISLKSPEELDISVQQFCNDLQNAAWQATPVMSETKVNQFCPINVRQKIKEKRTLRKRWQVTRAPADKLKLNQACKEIKNLLESIKSQSIQNYLENLTPTDTTDYSLWKATKKIKQPQQNIPPLRTIENCWARNDKEKAQTFAHHLESVFQPFPSSYTEQEENEILSFLDIPFQMDLPISNFTTNEIKTIIYKDLSNKKAPGFDLITGRILKELPKKGMRLIALLYNAVLRLGYFPDQWKIAQIILILKPGKDPVEPKSYRPISLLPVLSKVFEKLLLKRLQPVLTSKQLIPEHQFGFRQQHSTIEQIHRIVTKISEDFEKKRYCSAAFLDISQAFDKVWHTGLLYKLKQQLPHHFYQILKSYIENRHFYVRHQDEQTKLYSIQSGVPQGSVLGPVLYLLFTADLPKTLVTTIATFADDTAILSSHSNPYTASKHLQENLDLLQLWLNKWRIKVNVTKSVHITFALKHETCPHVTLNNIHLPQENSVKYLGLHLDRRLTWHKHIFTKRKQLGLKFTKMYWLAGRKSQLSLENKLLLYKMIIKPVWTYGIQLWGTASNSNIEILQRFQSKVLRCIVDAPWFVSNTVIHKDLKINSVKDEIRINSKKYSERLSAHPNSLAVNLLTINSDVPRLKRFLTSDLINRH